MDAKPESPTPPPRAPNKSRKALPILAVVALITALSTLLVLWSPWSGADGEPTPDESVTGQRSSSPDESPTGQHSPSTNDPTSPGQSGSPQPSDGGNLKRVPTVIGLPVRQAAAEVEREFSNVRLVADANGAGETCVVFAQDPHSGAFPSDTTVTLTFAGTDTECLA